MLPRIWELGLMEKSFTGFSEFQIPVAAWLNALDENLLPAARDSSTLREEERIITMYC